MILPRKIATLPHAAAVVSAVLLWLAFPPSRAGVFLVWFALVPLLLVVRQAAPRQAFWIGWLSGLIFWLLSLAWLWRLIENNGPWPLVVFGHVALAAYCALYTALFASSVAQIWRWVRARGTPGLRLLAVVSLEPLLWVGAEYLRSTLFTGFPWHALGVALVDAPTMIQTAALGGVYAVSFCVLLANGAMASLTEYLPTVLRGRGGYNCWRMLCAEFLLPLALLAFALGWGAHRVLAWQAQAAFAPIWRVALVQPNAPCIFERDDDSEETVRQTLLRLTAEAAKSAPDLTVWPETALMRSLPYDSFAAALVRDGVRAAGGPLLTGVVEYEPGSLPRYADRRFYNAAWLFDARGTVRGLYHKQHLVPFGEYIPGSRWIPVLEKLCPVGFSCTAGKESAILRISRRSAHQGTLPAEELAISPLICFEDTVAPLARRAVRRGARLLVNLTNDAWFNGSPEPEQHMAQAIFRCVENGVPLVRAANTGVSCTIDPVGRRQVLTCDGRTSAFDGVFSAIVAVPQQPLPTLYARCGDLLLAMPAAILLALVLLDAIMRSRHADEARRLS